mgnify:CR=1 FL=1
MENEKFLCFNASAQARLSTSNGQLLLLAKSPGRDGNLITLQLAEAGTESQATVSVSGSAITVQIGTSDDVGADNVATAINAHAAASALVTASNSGTSHYTAAEGVHYGEGGERYYAIPISRIVAMYPSGDNSINIQFESLKSMDGYSNVTNETLTTDSIVIQTSTANVGRELMEDICNAIVNSADKFIHLIDEKNTNKKRVSSLIVANESNQRNFVLEAVSTS